MPRSFDLERRKLWQGAGEGLSAAVELITATGVWAGIGFGLDRLFETWPVLFAIGAVVGHATGIYMLYRRSTSAGEGTERSES